MRKGNVHIIDILGIVQERVVCYNKDNIPPKIVVVLKITPNRSVL